MSEIGVDFETENETTTTRRNESWKRNWSS